MSSCGSTPKLLGCAIYAVWLGINFYKSEIDFGQNARSTVRCSGEQPVKEAEGAQFVRIAPRQQEREIVNVWGMRLGITWALVGLVMAVGHVMGLQCSADRKLKKYSLDKVLYLKTEKSTPPSTTTQEWYIDICSADRGNVPSECYDDDMICGLQWIKLPDKDPILTQVIHVNADKYEKVYVSNGRFGLSFKDIPYGDDVIRPGAHFQCDLDSEEDVVRWCEIGYGHLIVYVEGPSGCVKKEYDHDHANDPNFYYQEPGLPWFWWLFSFIGLFTVTCCILVSYLNTRGGSFQDFRDDFIYRIRTLVVSLASFVVSLASLIKETLSKVFNKAR